MTNPKLSHFHDAKAIRLACRSGEFRGTTSGLCPDQVQANLLVIPSKYADDFRGLCRRNPVSCPLLGENIRPGDPRLQEHLAVDSDIRRDIPGYNVYKDGVLVEGDVENIDKYWQEDSVAFLIGCSFTFEQALVFAGYPPRHQELGRNVPMYKTKASLLPSGVFQGNMVVSMRPYKPEDIERVRDISRPYMATHGEPVAWGWDGAKQLGIIDIQNPEFGDPPIINEGEVPVFWGCGVTPQLVVMSSPEVKGICLSHAPGKMICLDMTIASILGEGKASAAINGNH